MRRLFLGIALPEHYGELLADVRRRWQGRLQSRLRWVNPENWHVTLVFLGSVNVSDETAIVSALKRVRFAPFWLQGKGGGFFPAKGRPRVVWVGVHGEVDRLAVLRKDIEAALTVVGWEGDGRSFVPHLTLARVREARQDSWSALAEDLDHVAWPEFKVGAFVLWESVLHPDGARYRVRNVFSAMDARGTQAPHGENQC